MSDETPRQWQKRWNPEDEAHSIVDAHGRAADGDLVLRALNAHDVLVAALEGLVSTIDALTPEINEAFAFRQNHGFTYTGPTWVDALAVARAALLAAKGEA